DYEVYYGGVDLTNLKEYELSLKECVEYAYNNKAEVMSYKYQVDASKAQIDSVNAEYFPSIYLYGDYTKQKIDKLKQYMPEDSWQASINLDWNLYQGGSTAAQKRGKSYQCEHCTIKTHLYAAANKTSCYKCLYKSCTKKG
ncbi:MAG: TolC family protein, partial [Campylobacterales bacterium]|nr:TolC family protein [Campylobacterales bacterium]